MIEHLRQFLWALHLLWNLDGVAWPPDRLRLWKKSLRLYVSFLAFTDANRPPNQLHRTMICATLSAVYDYDSDWLQGNRSGGNFLFLLERFVQSEPGRAAAAALFRKDVASMLPPDGLERGGGALHLYWLVIDSEWMRTYTPEEIHAFGRKLQIIDDLLDIESDYLSGDTNCLLRPSKAQEFADEAAAFLESPFFCRLKENSRVYRVIEAKARKTLRRFGSPRVRFVQLFAAGRPATAGAYGLILPIVGFRFFPEAPWLLQGTTAICFFGLTTSIMVWNDWKDRYHDRKKGKLFASEHAAELLTYWKRLSVATGAALLALGWQDPRVALFCALVWIVGLLYSFVPHWYIVQNLIVALCGGAPVLCGAVWAGMLNKESLLTFLLLASLLFVSEVYKDIEDASIDAGYKATLPVRHGHIMTMMRLISLVFAPALLMAIHPNHWVTGVAVLGMPAIMFGQGLTLLDRRYVTGPKWTMKWLITALLVVLLVS